MTLGSVMGIHFRQRKDFKGCGGWVRSRGWTDMNPVMPVLDCLREVVCADICT